MELFKAITERRSARKFDKTPIEKEKLQKILEAGLWAPYSCNRQLVEIIVVTESKLKKKLVEESDGPAIILDAPIMMYVMCDNFYDSGGHANIQSAAAAIQNMLLAAYSEGISSLWMADYARNIPKLYEVLNIPKGYTLVAGVAFGYSDDRPPAPHRRDIKTMVHLNCFSGESKYPPEINPNKWTFNQIKDFLRFSIRAKSPFPQYFRPSFRKEFEAEISQIEKLEGFTLDLFPLEGNHSIELLKSGKLENLIVYDTSDEVIKFIKTKIELLGFTKNISYIIGGLHLPMKKESLDNIISFKKMEKLPDARTILNDSQASLKHGGFFYLFFTNIASTYGIKYLLNKKTILRKLIYGPTKPRTKFHFKKNLGDLELKKEIGIDLLPKTRFECYTTTSKMRNFCKTILQVYKKI